MIVGRFFAVTRSHLVWRVTGIAYPLPKSAGSFEAYVHNCRFSHFKKMHEPKGTSTGRDQHKKHRKMISSWVPTSSQYKPTEGLNQATEVMDPAVGQSTSSVISMDNCKLKEVLDKEGMLTTANEEQNIASNVCFASGSTTVETQVCSASIEVDLSLLHFVKGNRGVMQTLEKELGVTVVLSSPTSKEKISVVIQGSCIENVSKAAEKIKDVLKEAINSPLLDYSHFVSLPLAIHSELVDRLNNFQGFILGNFSQDGNNAIHKDSLLGDLDVEVDMEIKDDNQHVEVDIISATKGSYRQQSSVLSVSGSGIDKSIFIKPKTFHLTVLMLKLWNKERIAAATETLQKVYPKVLEALENRPVSIRLKGLECMKGSAAKARVLYAPVEEIGGEGRLLQACRVISEAYVKAGLVLDRDAKHSLKLHATLMNVRHRKGKKQNRWNDYFDARGIFKMYGSEDWGEYHIPEVHLSQRFAFSENGYYHCCASIPFPKNVIID